MNDLTVSSGILDMDPHTMSVGNDLTVNAAGTVQACSGTLSIGGDLSGLGTLEGESATIDIGGSITINNYQASSATTGVAGNWYVDSFIPGSGTVQFNGDGTVSSESFYNLQIISGTRTATEALTIVNDLSISAGALLTVGSYDLIVQGNVSGAGTLDGGSATIDVDGNSGVSNYTATSETTYVGGNWNVAGSFIPSAGNVVFDGSSTLGASTTFYNLTIQSGASLDTQGNSLWINGTYDNQGTLYRQGGDYVSTPDSDSGTTVYTTTGGNIQTYTGEDYYNLTISQALQTFTLPGSITIQNNITITAGTLDSASNDITVGGSWSNVAGASGFTAGSGTVIFEDVGITSVISGSTTFNNFTCTTPGKTIRFTAGSTQGIQGAFIVRGEQGNLVTLESTSSGSQWNIINNGDAEDVEYAAVQDSNNLAAAKIITAYSSKNNTGNTNWSFTGVIRSWKGSTSSWTTASNWDPGDNYPQTDDSVIILSGYTTPVLSGDVTVNDLEIKSAGTLDILGHALDVTNTFENQGTLKRYGMTSELDDKVTKTDFDSGTVMYHNTGGYVQDYGSQDYYNIIFDGSVVFTMSKALDATNNLQINTGATLDSGGKFITVSRNWSNSGTFTHGSSTVFFDDATKTSVISGNTSFYNFTCNTPGKTIQFTAGSRQTINGSFTIQGESGNYVKLTSSSDWELDNVGNTEDIDYADVEYSDASVGSGNTVDAVNSNNRGNNTNWSFTGTGDFFTWTGNSDADWNDGGNWDQAAVPGLGDTVIIPDVSPKPQPVMDLTSVTIKNLTIQSGASLDTGGNSLTITGNYDNQGTLYRMGSDYVSQTDIDSGTVVYRISGGSIQNYNDPGSDYYNLAIDSETFSISGKLEVALDLNFTSGGTLDLGSYSLTVGGDVTGTGNLGGGTSTVDINGSILVSGYTASSGITYVAGDWGVTNFNHNSGTVIFDGTSSQNVGTGTFWNLQVSIGSCTVVGALTIQNNISIGESGTLDGNGQTISVGGNWSNSGSFTHSSSTVAIIDSGKTTVISGDNTFHNFSCSTAGKTIQFTASETQTIQGSFTIQGALGALISLESTAGGTQWRIDNAGDAEDVDFAAIQDSNNVAGPTKIIIADDSIDNGNNLNWTINLIEKIWVGGTVGSETSWNTDGNWNPSGVPTAAYSVVIPSGQTYMPIIDVATVTIKNLTIESGASLSIQGNIINITNSFENQGTLYRQGDDSVSLTDSDSGLVVYKNSGGTIQSGYPGTDYYRLQINEPSAVFTLGDNLEVADDLTVADGTLSAGSYTITVAGDWSVAAGAFFNKGTGSVILNNTLEQSLESGGSAFYNLTKQGGSRLVITTNPLTVTGTLSISSGSDTVDMNNLGFTINTLVNNGTLELDGTQGTQSISSMDTDSGLVLYNGASGGIIRLIDFYNLEINRNARTFTLFDAVDINGDITITAGTLKTNSNTITVAGDWTNSGNFTAGSGTVVLDTTGPATISGNTGFYDLSCTTAGKTIQFAAGSTNNVSGTFNIQGVLGNHITHGSTSPGTAWKLNVVSSIVSFATVQDSDASGGNKVYASDSTDNGNNTNWDFNPGIVITSRSTEDYGSNAGQIDRIKLTAFEALNDDFSNISVKVSGYGTYSAPGDFETGTPLDNVFYVKISESGSPDTGVTPAVQITVNTSLKDNATGIKPVVTDPSAVTPADNAAPILTNASIASDNADSSLAKIGDTVTIAITASETLGGLPSVTIDGNAAAVVSTGGNSYEATRVMQAGDTEGVVAFTIDFADAVGNTGIQVTATTDASSVTFDETIPILNNVSITSNNANSALAIAGNTVTISFTSNETLIWSPAVTIDGNPADTVNDLGGNNYSATRVMQLGDTEGVIAFMIDFADSAGNAGAQVTVTTDSSSVSYDESAPQINISSLEEDNLYVDITFSEGVYNTSSGSGALETTDFAIIFIQNGGGATGVTIANVTKNDNNTLLGGETIVRVHLNISGYPSGDETIEITPADGSSIFDAAGNPVQVTETTGLLTLNEQPLAEGKVIIRNNIINPKRDEKTTINFRLDKSTKVNITVYDLNGDPVKVLYNRVAGAPLNEAVWDGKNKRGRAVVQGVYFVVVKIGKERFVKKVLVVR